MLDRGVQLRDRPGERRHLRAPVFRARDLLLQLIQPPCQGVHARAERPHLAAEGPDIVGQSGALLLAGGDLLLHGAEPAGEPLDLGAGSLGLAQAPLERVDPGREIGDGLVAGSAGARHRPPGAAPRSPRDRPHRFRASPPAPGATAPAAPVSIVASCFSREAIRSPSDATDAFDGLEPLGQILLARSRSLQSLEPSRQLLGDRLLDLADVLSELVELAANLGELGGFLRQQVGQAARRSPRR